MDTQTIIRTFNHSIFLKEGAFVRWKGVWYVFQGPFEAVENENRQVFSIACQDFYGHRRQVWRSPSPLILSSEAWKEALKSESPSCSFTWSGPSRELYSKSFEKVQKEIQEGNWQKAVPIAFTRASGSFSPQQIRGLLYHLAEADESLIPYGYWKDGVGVMGLTPEILFYRRDLELHSMALAGTEKKKGECHLLQDPKNLKEHNLVAQEVKNKLKNWGEPQMEGPQVLELPTLYHLLTQFRVQLESPWNDIESLQYFHPTSALGVSPHTRWKEMESLPEQKDRGFFGSPLLFKLSDEESLALVALRQIQWNQNEIMIGAGGGVVQESQEELEWEEILAKMDSVKKLMGIL